MNVDVRTAPGANGTVVILAAWCPSCKLEAMPDRDEADFDQAIRRASASPTAENLDRVQQATKTLRAGAPRRTRLEQDAAQALRALEVATQDFQRSLSEAA